jgi:hypothetical protein
MTIWFIVLLLEIFYGHLVYFVVIWYILTRFGYFVPRKIWQPCSITGWFRVFSTPPKNQFLNEKGIEFRNP